jgi:hypothetical protein
LSASRQTATERLDECRACTRPGNEICKPKEARRMVSKAHIVVAALAILAIALGVALLV